LNFNHRRYTSREIKKLNLIDDLYGQGLNNREIANYLNECGIRSPHGGIYSSKLVWVTHKKFKDKQERIKDTTFTVDKIYPAKLRE
jgi:DNA-binding transcriptional MerR regulator